jgi:phenylalanyl-tRNA synthetase beta chain
MKINVQWLKDYVEVPPGIDKLRDELTLSGLVVESVSQVEGDMVLEIEVTSNRPDCLSHVGVAREVAARYDMPLRLPETRKRLYTRPERVPFAVELADADLCPRYVALVMDGVQVGPSPEWMQRRLQSAGLRPVNNIVDITNYVLLELGHPLHAFDFDRLRGGKIVVGRAQAGEKFVTLDGIERHLDSEMLMINDAEGPVAIAGVMGGLNSEISLSTRRVLLESAFFRPASIRSTSKKLGLSTDASYRFERGADWDATVTAVARTCQLIEQIANGRIAGSLQDVYPEKIPPVQIMLSRPRAEALLGVQLTDDFVESTLRKLHFRPVRRAKGAWLVNCPTFRADMELEADLIEELARFYGYQNIPTTLPPSKTIGIASPVYVQERAAREALLGLGFSEGINLSFASHEDQTHFPAPGADAVAIRNPLTEDTGCLRTTLAAGLVKSVQRNFNHDVKRVKIFELGKVYRHGEEGRLIERRALGIAASGQTAPPNWHSAESPYDFFHLKGAVCALLRAMHSASFEIVAGAETSWLDPADACSIFIEGTLAGVMGGLHPALAEGYKVRQPVYLAELDFQALCEHAFRPVRHAGLPRFPAMERDLSLLLDRTVTYGAVRDAILSLGIVELTGIDLIDVYEGEKIPAGKFSMTLRLTFLDLERTLIVDRVQAFSDNVLAFLREKFGAKLR